MSLKLGSILLSLTVIACGQNDLPEGAVAEVNGAPVLADELEAIAAEAPADAARRLDRVIARKLAAGEARRRGLDREGAVRVALDRVRREQALREEEILRDALYGVLYDTAVVSEDELRGQYEKTRARYTERRLRLRRQRFASEAAARAMQQRLGAAGRLDATAAETIGPAPIEGLPRDVVPEALRLQRPGDRVLVLRDGAYSLVELVEILPAEPRSFDDVRAKVEKSLRTLRAQENFRAEVARLRAEARVVVDEDALRRLSLRPAEGSGQVP